MATLLISEDDLLLIAALGDRFRKAGFKVVEDLHSEAPALALRERPDLILLDIVQEISGVKLLGLLKADPATREIPVVMMTATPTDQSRDECLALGAAGYIVKPLDESAVMRFARLAVESNQRLLPKPP
jgi:CheY-like chemotaxis protein